MFVSSTIIQPWEQWGNAFSLCMHFVNCAFYFRYTSGDCLIDIASPLWECLFHRRLFSLGNSEVMHSACVCILSFVLSISGILLVIVWSTLVHSCGHGKLLHLSWTLRFIKHILLWSGISEVASRKFDIYDLLSVKYLYSHKCDSLRIFIMYFCTSVTCAHFNHVVLLLYTYMNYSWSV